MNSINKVCLAGNMTKDLEVKAITESFSIGSSTLAVSRSVKKGDAWEDETSFIDFKILGKTAVSLQKYLTKGTRVFLEGKLIQERWEDKEGSKHSRVIVQVDNINFASSKKSESEEGVPSNEAPAMGNDGFPEDFPF